MIKVVPTLRLQVSLLSRVAKALQRLLTSISRFNAEEKKSHGLAVKRDTPVKKKGKVI